MKRHTRYQAAILDGHSVLLLKVFHQRDGSLFWIIPGGGREGGETEEDCVIREVKEETGLDVVIERMLSDEPVGEPMRMYRRKKTYLCRIAGGVLAPGCEPEDGSSKILTTGWFDLRDETSWEELVVRDSKTMHTLRSLQQCLGYR